MIGLLVGDAARFHTGVAAVEADRARASDRRQLRLGLVHRVSGQDVHACDHVRAFEILGGLELVTVGGDRLIEQPG